MISVNLLYTYKISLVSNERDRSTTLICRTRVFKHRTIRTGKQCYKRNNNYNTQIKTIVTKFRTFHLWKIRKSVIVFVRVRLRGKFLSHWHDDARCQWYIYYLTENNYRIFYHQRSDCSLKTSADTMGVNSRTVGIISSTLYCVYYHVFEKM